MPKRGRDRRIIMLVTRSAQRLTAKITRLPPSDFDLRKRPTGNSGAFFLFVRCFGSDWPAVAQPEDLSGVMLPVPCVVCQRRIQRDGSSGLWMHERPLVICRRKRCQ